MSSVLAPVLLPSRLALWHLSLEALSAHVSPCANLKPVRWAQMRENALEFCECFGAKAIGLDWTAPQLFGVHRRHGTLRIDYCGVLMVSGARVQAVEQDWIVFERSRGFRNKPGQEWGPPIWEYAASQGR